MDDYFEDMAKKQIEKANALGESGENIEKKKKRQKLVEKVFADDKGYLVTEMVYEDVTDDENENTSLPTQPKKTNNNNTTVKNEVQTNGKETLKKGGKSSSVSKGQQRSMTSYFTKK